MRTVATFFADISELFLPSPAYVIVGLLLATVRAYGLKRSVLHRSRHLLAVLTVWSYVISTPVIANWLVGSLENRYEPPSVRNLSERQTNVIIVLSAGYAGVGLEQGWGFRAALHQRVLAGIDLWDRIGGKILIVLEAHESRDERLAEEIESLVLGLGVPKANVELHNALDNTSGSFVLPVRWNLSNRLWLVTSAAHMHRAVAVARRAGMLLIPYPTDYRARPARSWTDWVPSNAAIGLASVALHEYLGLFYYRMRGWATW